LPVCKLLALETALEEDMMDPARPAVVSPGAYYRASKPHAAQLQTFGVLNEADCTNYECQRQMLLGV